MDSGNTTSSGGSVHVEASLASQPLFCRIGGEPTISILSWLLPDHCSLVSLAVDSRDRSALRIQWNLGISPSGVATKHRNEVFTHPSGEHHSCSSCSGSQTYSGSERNSPRQSRVIRFLVLFTPVMPETTNSTLVTLTLFCPPAAQTWTPTPPPALTSNMFFSPCWPPRNKQPFVHLVTRLKPGASFIDGLPCSHSP